MELVNSPLAGVACLSGVAILVAASFYTGGTNDVSQGQSDSVPGWGAAMRDDLRGLSTNWELAYSAVDTPGDSGPPQPPSPVLSSPEPEVRLPQLPAATPAPAIPKTGIEQLVCSYGWDCHTALRVMWCESGGRPHAIGGGANFGLFQINRIHAAKWPTFWDDWMIPARNVEYAWAIYSGRGWYAWSCY